MKKKLVATVMSAVLALSVLAGCGNGDTKAEKVVTLQEIYDANYALAEKIENGTEIDGALTVEAAGKSATLLSLLGQGGEDLAASVKIDVKATKAVQYVEGKVDITLGETTEAEDVTVWNADNKTYTYNPELEMWTVRDSDKADNIMSATDKVDEAKTKEFIADLQKKIDDKDNTDVTLEHKNGAYELHCLVALSEIANVDGMDEAFESTAMLGISADSFKDMKGNIVINATFDEETLLVKSFELAIDDAAKEDIQGLLGTILPIEVGTLSIKAEISYVENSTLAVPDDVKSSAVDLSGGDLYDDLGNEDEE